MKLVTDLFLITYPNDYDWLPYLFRSIVHNVSGYDRLIVVVEEGHEPPSEILREHGPRRWSIERCRCYEGTDFLGYTGQAIEKLRAWEYSNADRVLIVDSDCVFTRPVNLLTDPAASIEKPIILWRPWKEAGDANCWHDSTAELLGFEPPHETMCRHPFIFPTWMLHQLWEHLGGEKRLLQHKVLSDFNLMGNFAMNNHFDRFTAIRWFGPADNHQADVLPQPNQEEDQWEKLTGRSVPPEWVHQFWSHHRATSPAVQKVLGKLGLL